MNHSACILFALLLPAPAEEFAARWDRYPPFAESFFDFTIPADDGAVRLGGQARTMLELYRNRDFGFAPVPDEAWVHHRIQTSAAWDFAEESRFFTELTWGEMQAMDGPQAPPDEDQIDLLQAYAQHRISVDADSAFLVRAGRQVLYYGSGRLLALREGANQRLVHDAVRLSWNAGGWSIDGLLASPVRVFPGPFDNESRPNETLLYGVYATGPSIDLYYLALDRDHSPLDGSAQELRHTVGTRWFGESGPWKFNHEFILQAGQIGDRDILAGATSLGGAYRLKDWPLQPAPGFRADLISGGQDGGDIHTFDPLFQANNYFNEGGFLSPSNLYNLNPRIGLQLAPSLDLNLGVNFLWRFDAADAVYGPPFTAVVVGAPGEDRYLGTAVNLSLSWNPDPGLELSLGYTHHEAGASLTSVGGLSVDYFQAAVRIEL